MTQFRIHQKGVAADAVTGTAYQPTPATIKLGVDVHQSCLVVVAQEDHAMLKPAPGGEGAAETFCDEGIAATLAAQSRSQLHRSG